jgi:hypothetical protein
MIWVQDKLYTKLVPYLLWALPAGVRNLPIYFKIFNYLEYDIWKMFDQVPAHVYLYIPGTGTGTEPKTSVPRTYEIIWYGRSADWAI